MKGKKGKMPDRRKVIISIGASAAFLCAGCSPGIPALSAARTDAVVEARKKDVGESMVHYLKEEGVRPVDFSDQALADMSDIKRELEKQYNKSQMESADISVVEMQEASPGLQEGDVEYKLQTSVGTGGDGDWKEVRRYTVNFDESGTVTGIKFINEML